MASPTLAEQLEAVDTAIYNLMNGGAVASYSISAGGSSRNISRMNLTELKNWRAQIKAEISCSSTNGGSVNLATFTNPQ
ncbi:MAG: hypothetical protein WC373_04925 [Smithella sp.]|jgi:hypothetical protein